MVVSFFCCIFVVEKEIKVKLKQTMNMEDYLEFEIGMLVKWNDPAIDEFSPKAQEIQRNREFVIVDIINEDMVLIADEYGEGEVFVDELELIKK